MSTPSSRPSDSPQSRSEHLNIRKQVENQIPHSNMRAFVEGKVNELGIRDNPDVQSMQTKLEKLKYGLEGGLDSVVFARLYPGDIAFAAAFDVFSKPLPANDPQYRKVA